MLERCAYYRSRRSCASSFVDEFGRDLVVEFPSIPVID